MRIVIDTREQTPLSFSQEHTVERGTLAVGDYSLAGLEARIAIERKSADDLVSTLSHGRDRFEAELQRAGGWEYFALVAETDWSKLARGQYRSQMKPNAVVQSLMGLSTRYHLPIFMAGSHEGAAYTVESLLWHYLNQRSRMARVFLQHIGDWQDVGEALGLKTRKKAS